MVHHVIYIPGIGDQRSYGQNVVIKIWNLFRLKTHYFPLVWSDKETFEIKLDRLLDKIDSLKKNDNNIYLVGVSAGASAALNAFVLRKSEITGVVCISGKINNPQTIPPNVYETNPAFKQSMNLLQHSLKKLNPIERKRIMSIHGSKDESVPVPDSIIVGAVEKSVPVPGHVPSIFYTLLFRGRMISRFLRQL